MLGGYKAWETAAAGVSTLEIAKSGKVDKRKFQAHWDSKWIATYMDILHNFATPKYQLIDSRSMNEINDTEGIYEKGKITDAINIPLQLLLDDDGMLYNILILQTIFRKHGIGNHPVIVYGNDVIEASMLTFALHNVGIVANIYPGGWPEWTRLSPNVYKVLF